MSASSGCGEETRTMPTAPRPGAVAMAAMGLLRCARLIVPAP
jgi:hypothetical protein